MKKIIACFLIASFLTGCNTSQLNEREINLSQKEEELEQREKDLINKEYDLLGYGKDLQQREKDIINKEYDLLRYEKDLQQRDVDVPEGYEKMYVLPTEKIISIDRAEYVVERVYNKLNPDYIENDKDFVCESIEIINGTIYFVIRIHQTFEKRFTTYGQYLINAYTEGVYNALLDERLENELRFEE